MAMMPRLLCRLGVVALVAAVSANGTRPSIGMVIYPWCAHYSERLQGENCAFTSYAQCRTIVARKGGSCQANPWYQPYPPPASYAPPLSR
jgi:hypothetical protein